MAQKTDMSLSKQAIEAFISQDREAQSGAASVIWAIAYTIANYIASGFTQSYLGENLLVERFREKPHCVSSGKPCKPVPSAVKGGSVHYVCEACSKSGLDACEGRTMKRVIARVPVTQQRISELLRAYRYASAEPSANAKGESQPAGFAYGKVSNGVNPFMPHDGRPAIAENWQAAEFVRLASGSKLSTGAGKGKAEFTDERGRKQLLTLAVNYRLLPIDGNQFATLARAAWKESEKLAKAQSAKAAKPPVDAADIADARKAHEARKAAEAERKAQKRSERKRQTVNLPPMPDTENPENEVLTESEALAANQPLSESDINALAAVA